MVQSVFDEIDFYVYVTSRHGQLGIMHHRHALTLYHTIPTFNDPKEEGFGKHRGKRRKCLLKGENADNQHFLLFQQYFLLYQREKNRHFSNLQSVICKYFQFGHVRKFVVW